MRMVSNSFVVLSSLLLLLCAEHVRGHDHTVCVKLSDTIVHECSAQYPVCCVWPNGLFIACCPSGTTCDLFRGTCVRSVVEGDAETHKSAESGEDTNEFDTKQPQGIEVSLQTSASFFGLLFVGVLFGTSFCTRCGQEVAFIQESHEMQQQLEERRILVAEGDSDSSDDEAAGPVVDVSNLSTAVQVTPPPPLSDGDASHEGEAHTEEGESTQLLPLSPAAPTNETTAVSAEEEEDESLLCKICYSRVANSVLTPCGHVACCTKCARKLATCPVCRQTVQDIVKLGNAKSILAALVPPPGTPPVPTTPTAPVETGAPIVVPADADTTEGPPSTQTAAAAAGPTSPLREVNEGVEASS